VIYRGIIEAFKVIYFNSVDTIVSLFSMSCIWLFTTGILNKNLNRQH